MNGQTVGKKQSAGGSHPSGFWFIFWGELAERASFYGMKTLLLLYMIQQLGYSDASSATVVSIFTAICYILPIFGGIIADRWLGKFKTVIYFSIPYILGHIFLGSFDTEVMMYTALLLLAGGSGSIKPNISTLMGQMYLREGKSHLLTQAFSWFYMAINVGASLTTFSLPFIRDHYGYHVAFIAPTILMVVSLGIFFVGKKHYPKEDVRLVICQPRTPQEKLEDRKTLWRLSGLFLLVVFFWSIFDQSYSTWTLFARDFMNLNLDIFGWAVSIPPDAVQSLNPVLIVIMTPIVTWIWSKTERSKKFRLSSTGKMQLGFITVILCMCVMSVAGYIAVHNKVSILWEVGAYVLVTIAELCISVIGLQLSFEEAPERMRSMITGVWLFTVFIGDILAALFARIYTMTTPGNYFAGMTLLMIAVSAAFYFVAANFERNKEHAR